LDSLDFILVAVRFQELTSLLYLLFPLFSFEARAEKKDKKLDRFKLFLKI